MITAWLNSGDSYEISGIILIFGGNYVRVTEKHTVKIDIGGVMGRNRKEKGYTGLAGDAAAAQNQAPVPARRRRSAENRQGTDQTRQTGKRKRKRGGGGTVVLILLIILVLAGIIFFVKDSSAGEKVSRFAGKVEKKFGIDIPFLGENVEEILQDAEELAAQHDYDGAMAVLKNSYLYDSSDQLLEKSGEYENARTAMTEEVNAVLNAALEKIGLFDYQGAIDTIRSSQYYEYSVLLQDKASEYQEALDSGAAVDENVIAQADRMAMSYDYDGAAELLKGMQAYENNPALQQKVADYEAQKAACVAINPEDVTHIFYHSLVVDPSKAFNPEEAGYDGWQQWMTTIYEFDKITQSMYDRGYVLVALDDLYTKETAADGTVTISPKQVFLPEGKKAFVLSLDDLSYYHTYDDHGVASRIVLDEEGKPTCEYIQDDGTVVLGDYDAVPRLDTFLEEHPDGCYKGARGTIALTGYDGILGYRTDGAYSEAHNTNTDTYYADDLQLEWLSEHPDFDWEKECADAKAVADAMKAEGWTFANHTWGHKAVGEAEYDSVVADTERWFEYVSPLIGSTDKIIFAHGQDIALVSEYTSSEKFQYLKSKGFDVYCPVDSRAYTTDVTTDFFHQGRRNLDGYRIYQDAVSENPLASDLFDANEVLDPERPLPVPEL